MTAILETAFVNGLFLFNAISSEFIFNNIILKINSLSFMTRIRHTDVKDFFQKSCLSNPQSLRDSPLLRGATPFLPHRRGTCRRIATQRITISSIRVLDNDQLNRLQDVLNHIAADREYHMPEDKA